MLWSGSDIRRAPIYGLLIILCLTAATRLEAREGEIVPDYDIFLNHDTLSVWIDLSPVLNQTRMEDLLAGLDLSLAVEISVEKPRRILFTRTLARARSILVLRRQLTEDNYRLRAVDFETRDYRFDNQMELSAHMADSLVFRIIPRTALEAVTDLRLKVQINVKSHSSSVLEEIGEKAGEAEENGGEVFESVFSFFLDLIGFGQTTYRLESPPFDLRQLASF